MKKKPKSPRSKRSVADKATSTTSGPRRRKSGATRVRMKRATRGEELGGGVYREPNGLRIAGLDTQVQVRRHQAARRLTLRVSQVKREAVLTMPLGSSVQDAARFVAQHMEWLRSKLEALPAPVSFTNGCIILYRGERHRIEFMGPTRHAKVAWTEGTREAQRLLREAQEMAPESRRSRVRLPERHLPRICVSGHVEHAPRRLQDWLMQRAQAALSERVQWHAENLGLRPRRVTIRDQVSRWGSCSSARVLSFSWRLILAPAFVLDYVAAHEVAHLKEMNHGPRFWAAVKRTFPRMDEARRWLRRHGAELHRYGLEI